jgi:hypothetical protein
MNWKPTVCVVVGLLGLAVLYWDYERRISDAEARAERAEETARCIKEIQTELVWQRLDSATEGLQPQMEEPRRREALERLRQEIQRLKNHFRFKKLEAGR